MATRSWLINKLIELEATSGLTDAEVWVISLDTDPLECGARTGDVIIFQEEDGSIGNVLEANSQNIEGWEEDER